MHCEIEFLPVGDASAAGDAIVVRYGYDDDYDLMLVDGGHEKTGNEIVEHLYDYFGPDPVVEHVVLTHSDADHASGLRAVLRQVQVNNLWLHVPWVLAEEARVSSLFSDPRWTAEGLRTEIERQYDIISELVDIAREIDCSIRLPFQGQHIGPFLVCSPSREIYRFLLPQFEKTPDPHQAAIEYFDMWIGKQSWISKVLRGAVSEVQRWVKESWDHELLRDGGITSASNESSVVLYGDFDNNNRVLLTGDAGNRALGWVADYLEDQGLPLRQFALVQVPHHGSRSNVGPTILNRLIGPTLPPNTNPQFSAFVSAPKDDSTHPRRIVLNAFKRRGAFTNATQGGKIIHWGGFQPRPNYQPLEAIPFYTSVEEYT